MGPLGKRITTCAGLRPWLQKFTGILTRGGIFMYPYDKP